MNQIVFFGEAICVAFVLWLGLFVVSRDLATMDRTLWQRPAFLAGIATILLGYYLLGVTMQTVSATADEFVLWQKITWWSTPLAVLLFFRAVVLIADKAQTRLGRVLYQPMLWWLLGSYALLLTVGILAGFFIDNQQIRAEQSAFETFYAPVRLPHFYFYNLFLALLLLSAVDLLLQRFWLAWRQNTHEYQRFKWLGYGSLLLIAGTGIGAVVHPLSDGIVPKQLGDLVLTLGTAAVSFGVARYNALGHDQIVEQDLWHSLVSVALTTLFYLVTFHGVCWVLDYPRLPIITPLLIVFAVITQTPQGLSEAISDRLLLPNWMIGYRRQLAHFRQELLTSQAPQTTLERAVDNFQQLVVEVQQSEIEELIQGEIEAIFQYTRLQDDTFLASSKLFRLHSLQSRSDQFCNEWGIGPNTASDSQKAAVLRTLLLGLIEGQVQNIANNTSPQLLADEQIEILILKKKYIDQLTRSEVERFFYDQYQIIVAGGAYSRHLASGRQRLARRLHEMELAINRPPQ